MRMLPRRLDVIVDTRRLAVIDGAVDGINRFAFASTPWEEKARQIGLSGCGDVIGGHSGIPFSHEVGGGLWHNSGTLGMPANDGTQRVWYSLFVPATAAPSISAWCRSTTIQAPPRARCASAASRPVTPTRWRPA